MQAPARPLLNPQKSCNSVVGALVSSKNPFSVATEFKKNPVKSIASDLLKNAGYSDLYAERYKAEKKISQQILNALFEITHKEGETASSTPFIVEDTQGHQSSYHFIKDDGKIVRYLGDMQNGQMRVDEYSEEESEKIQQSMESVINRATGLAESKHLGEADESLYNEYEIELAQHPTIRLKALQHITDNFHWFEPKVVMKAAQLQLELNPGISNPIAKIINDVGNHKSISTTLAHELASYITNPKNHVNVAHAGLHSAMLWVFKQRDNLIPKADSLFTIAMKGVVTTALDHIFAHHSNYKKGDLAEATNYLLTLPDDHKTLRAGINCVVKHQHDFDKQSVDRVMGHIISQPAGTLDETLVARSAVYVLAYESDFSKPEITLATKYINDKPNDFTIQHNALFIIKNPGNFSYAVLTKALNAIEESGLEKAAITSNDNEPQIQIDSSLGKIRIVQTPTSLTATLNDIVCSTGGFTTITSLQEYLRERTAAATTLQKSLRFFKATKVAEPGGEVPALRDNGKLIAYRIPTKGGLNWVALPEELPKATKGKDAPQGTFKILTHRNKTHVGLTLKDPNAITLAPHLSAIITNHQLDKVIPLTKIDHLRLIGPNLGKQDLFGLVEDNLYTFKPSHFKKIAQQISKLHALGITHRDIKLENMFYKKGHVYLSDLDSMGEVGTFTSVAGTAGYRLPSIQKISDEYQKLCTSLNKLTGAAYDQQLEDALYFSDVLVACDNGAEPDFNSYKNDQYAFFTAMMVAWSKREPGMIHSDAALIHDFVQQMSCDSGKKAELEDFLTEPEKHSLPSSLDSYL